jgi:SOS-response transcriptional repressor LexA
MKNSTKRKHLKLVAPRPHPTEDTVEVFYPAGFHAGDDTFSMTAADNAHAHAGLYEGDTAVCYATLDVTADDIAVIEINGECWLGKYRPAPGGYFSFEEDGETKRFKPGTALLLGRVCHFERRGEIVRRLRPIR